MTIPSDAEIIEQAARLGLNPDLLKAHYQTQETQAAGTGLTEQQIADQAHRYGVNPKFYRQALLGEDAPGVTLDLAQEQVICDMAAQLGLDKAQLRAELVLRGVISPLPEEGNE